MSTRKVFLSYHHERDHWRAYKIRKMFEMDTSLTFSEDEWEEVENKADAEIEEWVDSQIEASDCVVVLIGEETAKRKWINYTIKQAYEMDKAIVGVYVHKLIDDKGNPDERGENPFNYLDINSVKFSRFVKTHDSEFVMSRYVYHDIRRHLADLIEYGIEHKPSTWEWEIYSRY